MALDQYNQEGQNLLTQYSMLGDMADTEYSRHQDALNQYWQNVSYQKQLADDAYERGYGASRDQIADQQWQDSFQYQQNRDQVADQQWQAEFNEAKRQYDQQYELSKNKSTSSGSSSSSRTPASEPTPTKEPDNKPTEKPKSEYQQLVQDLDTLVSGGASKSQVSGLIRQAVSAGVITQNQAQKLLQTYNPRGITY